MNDSSQVPAGVTRCLACGAVVDPNRAQGLCPACTWRLLSEHGTALAETGGNPPPPDGLFQVGNLVVIEEIARGGMGIVYRARQLEPARAVAIKMLLPHQLGSEEMRERFRLEIRAIAGLDHPAILPVYQVGEYEGMPYFTMKLAAGGTLASRVPQFKERYPEIAKMMISLAGAVQFAHERGVLHRDLKPGNILFDDAGRSYVSDFGLAKFTGFDAGETPAITRSIQLLGTPQFLSPEVVTGGVSKATTSADVYSLGAILYELLTCKPPFVGQNLTSLLKAISESEPDPPSQLVAGLPRDLEVICLKCLAKEPSRRYRTASELADDLQRWLDHRPILARPVSPVERAWQWSRNHQSLAALSMLLIVTLLGGAVLLVRANYRLESALRANVAANATAQHNLYAALLVQARLLRSSGDFAQRSNLLAVLRQAAGIQPSLELRNEAVAALALPASVGSVSSGQLPVFAQFADSKDQGQSCTVDISQDGRLLVTGTTAAVHLWDANSRAEIWSRPQIAVPWMYVAFPPDGKSLLYSSRNFGIQQSQVRLPEGSAQTTPLEVGSPQTIGREHDSTIMGFSASKKDWVVAADRTGLYISRVETWPEGNPDQARVVAAGQKITWLALSPDEKWAASTTFPAYDVRIWDGASAKNFALAGATNAIMSAFSPDGRFLVVRMPKDYGLWETGTWRFARRWHVGFEGRSTCPILFSRDATMLAAPLGGNRFQLLDARTFSELCVLSPPVAFESAWSVWSRDDQKFYVMDGSHRIFEWNLGLLRQELAALRLGWSLGSSENPTVEPNPAGNSQKPRP